jgi:O-acetyl-ADP-ribose deacetylase (regulator of RNase III)
MEVQINGKTIELKKGDITHEETDAIVNAANEALVLGGGVAGAIARAGGLAIQEECHKKAPIRTGEAVITTGGNLKARYVIHAAGPRMGDGDEEEKLRSATLNSLKIADENGLKSISFPAVSAGVFGYPIRQCAKDMLGTAIEYLKGNTGIERIVFVLFTDKDYMVFEDRLKTLGS